MFNSYDLHPIYDAVQRDFHDFNSIKILFNAIRLGHLPAGNHNEITAVIQRHNTLLLEISLLTAKKTTWQENVTELIYELPDDIELVFTDDNGNKLSIFTILSHYKANQILNNPLSGTNFSIAESLKISELCLKLRQAFIFIKDALNPLSLAQMMFGGKVNHMTINMLAHKPLFLAVKTILQLLHFFNACAFGENVAPAALLDHEPSEKFNLNSANYIAHRANIIKQCCQSPEITNIFAYFLNEKALKNQNKLNQLEQVFYLSQQIVELVYQLNQYLYINEAQLIAKTMFAYLEHFFQQKMNHSIKHIGGIKLFDLKLDYLNLVKELSYSYLFQKNYLQAAILVSKHHQRSIEWFPGSSRDDVAAFNHAVAILYACETNNVSTATTLFAKIESLVTKHTKKSKKTEQSDSESTSILAKALASAEAITQSYAKLTTATALANPTESLAYSEQQLSYLHKQLHFWRYFNFDINDYEFNTPSSQHNKNISHHTPFLFSSKAIIENKVKILEKFITAKRLLLAPPVSIAPAPDTTAPIPAKAKSHTKTNRISLSSSSNSSSSCMPSSAPLNIVAEPVLPVSSYIAMANSLQKKGKPVVGKSKYLSTTPEQPTIPANKQLDNVTWPITNHSFQPNDKTNKVYTLSNEPYVATGTWYTWLDRTCLQAAGASDKLINKIDAILARGLLTSKSQGIVCMDKKYQQKNSNYCYKIRLLGKEYGDVRIYGYIAEKINHQSLVIFDHIEFKGHKPYLLPEIKTPSDASKTSFNLNAN